MVYTFYSRVFHAEIKSPKIRDHVRLSCSTASLAKDHTLNNVVTKGFSFTTQVNYHNKTGIPDNIMLHAHFLFTLIGYTNPKFQLPKSIEVTVFEDSVCQPHSFCSHNQYTIGSPAFVAFMFITVCGLQMITPEF